MKSGKCPILGMIGETVEIAEISETSETGVTYRQREEIINLEWLSPQKTRSLHL